ncbi:MAG: alpha/beta fold hydrolase [Actinomycetales bacterium]
MSLRLPDDFTHDYVELPDLRVHYVREGSGPPLVLWHGWPGFWWDWRYLIGPLSEHFDVIVPDFRGAGDSEKTDLSDLSKYTMTQVADDQAAFLDALGISQAYVVGHDYGATVAHKFLRRHPERVIKAMILDAITPGYGSMEGNHSPEDWFCIFHEYDSALELVSLNADTRRIYYKHFFDHWSYRKPLLTDQEMSVMVDNYMKPGNVHGGFNYDRANLSRYAEPWTSEDHDMCDLDVTVLWAADDPAVPPSGSEQLPRFYSNYTLDIIPECGHFVMIEKPDVVLEKVLKKFQ